jgi:AcrR family transcriptional regulator
VIHEAFFYSSDDEFAAYAIPFLLDGLAAGQAAIAVTTEPRIALLRSGLGDAADAVGFYDGGRWYRRPGKALVAWRDALDQQLRQADSVRAIGEIVLAGDHEHALRNWTRYEWLLNRAFADRAAWIVCPYNTETLPEAILLEAGRTHPVVSTTSPGRAASAAHFESQEVAAPLRVAGSGPKAVQRTRADFRAQQDLQEVRSAVRWQAQSVGLSADLVDDLLLAVAELVDSRPSAVVSTARRRGEWLCEVRAAAPQPLNPNDFGVLIGRVISDRVEIADDEDGQVVRFVWGDVDANPRARIINAASDLFRTNGVRTTGINAVIAHAGVAKATFYAHFRSKDELVRLWLKSPSSRWFDHVRAEIDARTDNPVERLTAFFDVLGEWLVADDFHGCPFLNTATEFRGAEHGFTQELADLTAEIEGYFRRNAQEAGFADPDDLARQLFLLVPGTITTATARGSIEPARAAQGAANVVVAAAAIA